MINPMQCRGQVDGGVAQSLGSTLYEEMLIDDTGRVVNPTLRNYHIPAFADVPRTEVMFADTTDLVGPMGAKPMSESPYNPVPAAIGNALADATGIRFCTLPFKPDCIFPALHEKFSASPGAKAELTERVCKMSGSAASHEAFLRRAFAVAKRAHTDGNHPFGAILVDGKGAVLLEVENGFMPDHDRTAHAERLLATQASKTHDAQFLAQCTLYTSAEPCAMCSGAIYWAGIGRVVFGLTERRLKTMTGNHDENPTMDLPCRTVFAAGQRPVEVSARCSRTRQRRSMSACGKAADHLAVRTRSRGCAVPRHPLVPAVWICARILAGGIALRRAATVTIPTTAPGRWVLENVKHHRTWVEILRP